MILTKDQLKADKRAVEQRIWFKEGQVKKLERELQEDRKWLAEIEKEIEKYV